MQTDKLIVSALITPVLALMQEKVRRSLRLNLRHHAPEAARNAFRELVKRDRVDRSAAVETRAFLVFLGQERASKETKAKVGCSVTPGAYPSLESPPVTA